MNNRARETPPPKPTKVEPEEVLTVDYGTPVSREPLPDVPGVTVTTAFERARPRPFSVEPEEVNVTPANPVAAVKPPPTLSDEQAAALERIQDWYTGWHSTAHAGVFRLFGPAGTGKTTLARHIAGALNLKRVAYGAFTGKAAKVLRSKGMPATTIHSAIYSLDFKTEARAALREKLTELAQLMTERADPIAAGWANQLELDGAISEVSEEIDELLIKIRKPAFTLNPMSEWGYADLIVLDEVSMVSERIARDIESYGVPVLVLGDPAQLPPIEGGGHYTNATPDVLLEHVHRQALESPVLALATDVRCGKHWFDRLVKVDLAEAMAADQILVWKNSTRWNLTRKIREKLKLPLSGPVPGDRIMCLVNNKDIGTFNGEQFTVKGVRGGQQGSGTLVLDLVDDDGRDRGEIGARAAAFTGYDGELAEKRAGGWQGDTGVFTFADVITVHKAQGSEWPSVYVVDQTHQMTKSTAAERRAWMYTAISRASERVTIASTNV